MLLVVLVAADWDQMGLHQALPSFQAACHTHPCPHHTSHLHTYPPCPHHTYCCHTSHPHTCCFRTCRRCRTFHQCHTSHCCRTCRPHISRCHSCCRITLLLHYSDLHTGWRNCCHRCQYHSQCHTCCHNCYRTCCHTVLMCWHNHCWSRLVDPMALQLLLCWCLSDSILHRLSEPAPMVLELMGQLYSLLHQLAPRVWEEGLTNMANSSRTAAEQQCQGSAISSGMCGHFDLCRGKHAFDLGPRMLFVRRRGRRAEQKQQECLQKGVPHLT